MHVTVAAAAIIIGTPIIIGPQGLPLATLAAAGAWAYLDRWGW